MENRLYSLLFMKRQKRSFGYSSQHYEPVRFGSISLDQAKNNFKIQQIYDNFKRDYAKLHNIQLLEIPYWDFDNIEQILESRLLLKQSA